MKRVLVIGVLTLALMELPVLAHERAPELLAQGPVPHAQKPGHSPAHAPAVPRAPAAEPAGKKAEAAPNAPAPNETRETRAPSATGSAVGPRRLSAEERAQLREQIRDMRRRYGTEQPGTSGG